MPAEWETHSATQLHWPHNRETWPGNRLNKVEKVYIKILEALTKYEHVHLFVANKEIYGRVGSYLSGSLVNFDRLFIHEVPINDVWARDCGPIFVQSNNAWLVTDWEYNAWGEKYPPWDADNALPEFVGSYLNLEVIKTDFVLEGGSIDTNGEGVFITTRSVLLNPNRNPGYSTNQIEQILQTHLGAKQVIWLNKGLAGDDTDGHVDDLTRFLNKETVLTMVCEDKEYVNYAALQENLEILRQAKLPDGRSLNIETLPLPKTKVEDLTVDGSEYVPASYANFYIANGVVLVPLYEEKSDTQALELFTRYFPERDIVGIPCADLVWGQGAIHCITQPWYGH